MLQIKFILPRILLCVPAFYLVACGGSSGGSDGSDTATVPITVIEVKPSIEKIATNNSSCVVFSNGKLKCWGASSEGLAQGMEDAPQILGDGPNEMGNNLSPLNLAAGITVAQISSGSAFNCLRSTTGQVQCWGDNSEGQLGAAGLAVTGDEPGEMGDQLPFVNLGTGRTAQAIVSGSAHSCALLDNSDVKCWGNNRDGRLGLGDSDNRGDDANEMGDNLPALDFGVGRTAVSIVAGEHHNCVLLDNNTTKCWGSNYRGKLGLGNTEHRGDNTNEMGGNLPVVDLGAGRTAQNIAAGDNHTCALLDNDSVKCWGDGPQLGHVRVFGNANLGDDANEMGDNFSAVDLGTGRTAQAIVTGANHTCVLLDNSAVKCWGYNFQGQLGLGDTEHYGDGANEMGDNLAAVDLGNGRFATELVAGYSHTCAKLDNSTLKCWGSNYSGKLGLGDTEHYGDGANEMGDNLAVVNLGAGRTVQTATGGNSHTCALLDNNAVKCWGGNWAGQLGAENGYLRGDEPDEMGSLLPYINLGTNKTATDVAVGDYHVCALLNTGEVKCWGDNWDGFLGLGDTVDRGYSQNEMGDNLPALDLGTGRIATAVTVGNGFSCALLENGNVKCWGEGFRGQLGSGDTISRGDNANEMGDNLAIVDLGSGRTAQAIAAGTYHVCALLDNSSVKCWGVNGSGRLGQGDTATRGDAANEMGDNLLAIDLGTGRTATAIATGNQHTCALLDNSSLKCWGYNIYGQLGLDGLAARGDSANEMGDNLPAIDLGASRSPVAITAGYNHTCALLDDASVKCWGDNQYGQLGQGNTTSRGRNNDMGNSLSAIDLGTGRTAQAIQAGRYHTCAALDDDSVKCWGSNEYGRLGIGSTDNRGDEAGEMGATLPVVNLLD